MAAATMAPASMSSSLVAGTAVPRTGTFAAARSSPAALALPRRRDTPVIVRATNKSDNTKSDTDLTTGEPVKKLVEELPISNDDKPGRLWDAMAFTGPAPERINGRLAMVGFVSALAVEASRGVGLLSQASGDIGMTWFTYSAVVLSVASLAPLLQGEDIERWSRGIWRADAELWNGRAAMIGLVALAATEYLKGAPLINV